MARTRACLHTHTHTYTRTLFLPGSVKVEGVQGYTVQCSHELTRRNDLIYNSNKQNVFICL